MHLIKPPLTNLVRARLKMPNTHCKTALNAIFRVDATPGARQRALDAGRRVGRGQGRKNTVLSRLRFFQKNKLVMK